MRVNVKKTVDFFSDYVFL